MQIQSIGVRLKSAREKTKLSLEDIATQGRLSIKRLHALENNQVQLHELTAFDKSYLKKYCQIIGVVYDDLFHDLRIKTIDTQSLKFEPSCQPRTSNMHINPKGILMTALFVGIGFGVYHLVSNPITPPSYVDNQILIDNETVEQI